MEKINISFPDFIQFETIIPLRITDLNYGGHVGNNTILTLAHEARVQFLNHFGCNGEKDLGDGAGIIMVDAAIQFKAEIFYPGELIARLSTDHITERSFDLYYKFILKNNLREAALIKTGIVCFDYQKRRPSVLPVVFKQQLENTKI